MSRGALKAALLRRRAWPLWVWASGVAVVMGVIVTGGCLIGLAIANRLSTDEVAVTVGAGALGTLIAAVGAAFAADNAAAALRSMSTEVVSALSGPTPPLRARRGGVRRTAEMADLDAVVAALALRMRVADELAARAAASAETASAGMFELLSAMIVAEETARGQLSAELHDTVAQSLAVARAMLGSDQAERGLEMLDEAEDQVRALMARTRPPALRGGDLGMAVTALCDDLQRRYGLRVRVEWPDRARPLPMATAVMLYRFFSEALLNVVKHAEVDDAELALRFAGQSVTACVGDRGQGFAPGEVQSERGRHVGLVLLRERVRLGGGSVKVASAPGDGTTLTARLPWAPPPADQGGNEPGRTDPAVDEEVSAVGAAAAARPPTRVGAHT